jgi:transcriptional regulator with XRE-family HTH domain
MRKGLLRELRKKTGTTLEELSEAAGLSVSQLSRFESGQRVPRVTELERIARHLGVGAWLFLDEQPRVPSVGSNLDADEASMALYILARRIGMSDKAATEAAGLFLEEMLNHQSPILSDRKQELLVAFDRIIRRLAPKSSG